MFKKILTYLILRPLELLILVTLCFLMYFNVVSYIPEPELTIAEQQLNFEAPVQLDDSTWVLQNNWLRREKEGLYIGYIEGDAYERGLAYGTLLDAQIKSQEDAFLAQLQRIVPDTNKLHWLKRFIAFYNRDLEDHVPLEYQKEIFGVAQHFNPKYQYIAPNYYRILNYHAAHDIGHALHDLNMVGCSSFALDEQRTMDSTLTLARNFDFYMGKEFAENKLLMVMRPDSGYAFASYAWAGLMGVCSGMNEAGLTITLNAAPSEIPMKAKTPISILARMILQYAGSLEEAIAIAKKHEIFVSESLMIGSGKEGKAIVIEKTPTQMDIFEVETGSPLYCSNHYQSEQLKNQLNNITALQNSDSPFRWQKMEERVGQKERLNVAEVVEVLRDKTGLGGKDIGLNNPKALNQLIAHHAIVFQPSLQRFWISTAPYQEGAFLAFNLSQLAQPKAYLHHLTLDSLNIESSADWTETQQKEYAFYEDMKIALQNIVIFGHEDTISQAGIERYIHSNPKGYLVYESLGDYYTHKKDKAQALNYYGTAKAMELPSQDVARHIEEKIGELLEK